MTKAKIMQAHLGLLTDAVLKLAEGHSDKTIYTGLAASLGLLNAQAAATTTADGRAAAWTEERRLAQGEKVAQAWAAKREALKEKGAFFKFTYSNEAPVKLASIDAFAEDSGLAKSTIQNRLSTSPAGLAIKKGRAWHVYVRDVNDLDKVLSAPAIASGDEDKRIVLPRKGVKRF